MKVLIVAISLFSLFGFNANPLVLDSTNVVIEVQSLTPDVFKGFMLKSLDHNKIEIIEACVPAEVIYIRYDGQLDGQAQEDIIEFFSSPILNSEVNLLLEESLEDFTQKCLAARLGN